MPRRKEFSRLEVLALIRKQIAAAGSLRKYAAARAVSAAYLSDVMRGRRDPGPALLAPFKLRRMEQAPPALRYERVS